LFRRSAYAQSSSSHPSFEGFRSLLALAVTEAATPKSKLVAED
jgi:hypothetical protein